MQSQSIFDIACEILQKTNDGNDLSPGHLSMVQHAVNGNLTEKGETAFYALHKMVLDGYKKPWYHDIEHMTQDLDGYIYWKDKVVEHYDFEDYDKADFAIKELAERCKTLEKYGIIPTTNTAIWWWGAFHMLEMNPCPAFHALLAQWKVQQAKGKIIKTVRSLIK